MRKSSGLKQHSNIKYSADLSSSEVWQVLVNLLREAAAPLAVYGSMSIELGLSCLALSTNNRRKISESTSDEFLPDIFYELSTIVFDETPEKKLGLLEFVFNSGVERNIIVDHIVFSLSVTKFPAFMCMRKLRNFVARYLEDYEVFKQDVFYRYYNMTEAASNKNHKSKAMVGLHSTRDDMKHVYTISAMRAIDRFIPTKGTLTSYIEQWFQNAKGSSDYIVYDGEAISINRTTRRSVQDGSIEINTKAIPLEDRENTIPDEFSTEEKMNATYSKFSQHIARLPNSTILFLALNLPYLLSEEQKKRLRSI